MADPTKLGVQVPLKQAHSTLFWLLVVMAAMLLVLAGFLIFEDGDKVIAYTRSRPDRQLIPLPAWGTLFAINALLFLRGAFSRNGGYKWARYGLIYGAILGGYWAAGFWLVFLQGTILGVSAPVLWTMYCLICVVLCKEPAINPVTLALMQHQREKALGLIGVATKAIESESPHGVD